MNQCIFCSSFSGPDETELLSKEQIIKVLDQAVDLGLEEVAISGGEPLLHPDLKEVLEYCKKIKLKVALYTSGVVEFKNNISAFCNWSSMSKYLNRVVFDVTSLSPANRDILYGRDNAIETMQSISAALPMILSTEAHIIPNKINLFGLKRLVKYLDKKINKVSFLRLVVQGRALIYRSELEFSLYETYQLNEIISEISDMDILIRRRFGMPWIYTGMSTGKCNAGITKLVVTPSGHIAPCEALKNRQDGQFFIGHVDVTPLKKAIINAKNSESLNKLRDTKIVGRDKCIAQRI
jgi:radical SAM protein with 4Fe4S-binding SPASM domain